MYTFLLIQYFFLWIVMSYQTVVKNWISKFTRLGGSQVLAQVIPSCPKLAWHSFVKPYRVRIRALTIFNSKLTSCQIPQNSGVTKYDVRFNPFNLNLQKLAWQFKQILGDHDTFYIKTKCFTWTSYNFNTHLGPWTIEINLHSY